MPVKSLERWWRRFTERPFGCLVRHFLARLVSGGEDAGSGEVELGAGAILGILAAPGAFASVILSDKYSTFLNWYRGRFHLDFYAISVPDKYLFIALAMAVTGIVTVLKWDKILPDAQDYLNLAPLPVRARTVLYANATAIAAAALIVAIDISAASAVLFPFFVCAGMQTTMAEYFRFSTVHAFCMALASLFTFCAVLALLGTLAAVLPRPFFRQFSSWIRSAILIAFLTLLMSAIVGPQMLLRALAVPGSLPRYLPSLWYLALYQDFQKHGTPALDSASRFALPGLAAALALTVLCYALSYRRRYAAVLEDDRRPSSARAWALAPRLLDLFAPRATGFGRACHRFAVRALLRNETHRITIGVALGMGALSAYRAGLWQAPYPAAYLLVLALRIAFEFPAGIPAAWIFRAILDPKRHETQPVARRIASSFLVPVVLLPAAALVWWMSGFAAAALHGLFLSAMCLLLIEVQFGGYRKIPMACPMPGLRDGLAVQCGLQFLGFELFTHAGPGIESWLLAAPLRFLAVPVVLAAAWCWNQRRLRQAREDGELEQGLTFDTVAIPTVERLDL